MLTPQQLLGKMLETVVSFDGAHQTDSLDRAILKAEANSLFRILRVIEESSGQRFAITATGHYLDLIGQGINRPRYQGESDADYRSRLVFNEAFWNDVTVSGIKNMIKSYYGIDLDGDEFEETRLVELYRQAIAFFSEEEECEINPSGEFGAEWLSPNTLPGAFEVHLKCFQDGEEKLIKKRQVKNKLMAIRGAGIVVLLYFHINQGPDVMQPPEASISELELISQETVTTPEVLKEGFELEIKNNEITNIIANSVDKLKGLASKRIVHLEQTNKCRPGYEEELQKIVTQLDAAKFNAGAGQRRAEPFRFRESRLRNECWTFYYGVKYEERDITASTLTLSLAWNKPATFYPQKYKVYYDEGTGNFDGVALKFNGVRVDSPFYVEASVISNLDAPAIILRNASMSGLYSFKIAAIQPNGDELLPLTYAYSTYNEGLHTYYTRPNPMIDATHHYRGDDTYSPEFYSLLDYCNFWWRVSSVENGTIQATSLPWKLIIYKTQEPVTRFWCRISTIDGQIISAPSKAELIKIVGQSLMGAPIEQNIMQVTDWQVRATNINMQQLAQSNSELIILERYSGSELWQRFDIITLKVSRTPSRLVLAILPVCGAIESDLFLSELSNADKGAIVNGYVPFDYTSSNVKEKYWDLLDVIIRQGFDGVLLDGLWLNNIFGSESLAMDFVIEIIHYLRVIKSHNNFKIIVRGAEHWVYNTSLFAKLDGVLSENLFYLGDVLQPASVTADKISNLNVFYTNAKQVFVIDYVTDVNLKTQFIQKCNGVGFLPFITSPIW